MVSVVVSVVASATTSDCPATAIVLNTSCEPPPEAFNTPPTAVRLVPAIAVNTSAIDSFLVLLSVASINAILSVAVSITAADN